MIKSASRSSITNDQKYRSMLAGTVPSSEYLITTTVLTQTEPSITFNNLAQFAGIYRHIQIVGVARVTSGTTIRAFDIRFNGDSGANYNGHILIGEGNGTPYAGGGGNTSNAGGFYMNGGGNPAGAFGAGIIDILEAFSTTKFKSIKYLGGQTGYNILSLGSSSWRNTTPIDSIQLYPQVSESFAAGTRFSIYGVVA